MTPAERVVWSRVRRKQILGAQFYRQKPIDQYIADFYCPKARLVIEIDGGQHREPEHEKADRARDEIFARLGLRVLRFSNLEVLSHLDAVLERIYAVVENRKNRGSWRGISPGRCSPHRRVPSPS